MQHDRNVPTQMLLLVDAHAPEVSSSGSSKDRTAAEKLFTAGVSENTQRARISQLKAWGQWLQSNNMSVDTPPTVDVVSEHVGFMANAGASRASIAQRMSTISWLCESRGWENPVKHPKVAQLLRGVKRVLPPENKKEAFTKDDIRLFVTDDLTVEERALVLTAIVTGVRVSELTDMVWSDASLEASSISIKIPKSKTDQMQRGAFVSLPRTDSALCPYAALKALKAVSVGNTMFPTYKDPRKIRLLVKRLAEACGRNPDQFSAHSFRATLATLSHEAGVPLEKTQEALRHTRPETTQGYIRRHQATENPTFSKVASML